MEASTDNYSSAQLIDDYYTNFTITEDDRECFERFLDSTLVEVRREALIALLLSGPKAPKFTGYALDALTLQVLALIEENAAIWRCLDLARIDPVALAAKSEPAFTALSALVELEMRGDKDAASILQSLGRNERWRKTFRR